MHNVFIGMALSKFQRLKFLFKRCTFYGIFIAVSIFIKIDD